MTTWTAPFTPEGWAEPGTSASNVPTTSNSLSWASVANVRAGQPWAAQATLSASSQPSTNLYVSLFGLAIPTTATILGVEVEIESGSTRSTLRVDTDVRLAYTANAATMSSANRAMGLPLTALSSRVYGGPSDLWGDALTPAQLNSSSFGVVFRLGAGSSTTGVATLRSVRVRVTYSTPEDGEARVTQARADALITQPGDLRVSVQRLNALVKSEGFARVTATRVEVIRSIANGVVEAARRRRQMFLIGD